MEEGNMEEDICQDPARSVNITLAELNFESFGTSVALETLIEQHRSKDKEAKVVFHINSTEDVHKMFCVVEELERRIMRKSKLPEFILEDIPNKAESSSGIAQFWPCNWVSNIELDCKLRRDVHLLLEKLYDLPNIERLALRSLQSEVPLLRSSIGKLKKLKCLSLQLSREYSLPPILRFCKDMEELDLRSNYFRYLPFWITKLEKLETLRRFGNPLLHQVNPYECIERVAAGNANTETHNNNANNEKKRISPNSLFLLAATTALVEFPQWLWAQGEDSLEIPRDVWKDILSVAPIIKFCDHCNQIFVSGEYTVMRKTFKDFKGYKNIPFEAMLCSDVCADKLYKQWAILADTEKVDDEDGDDNQSLISNNSVENLALPMDNRQELHQSDQSGKISNILRKIMCWRCSEDVR